MLMQTAAAEAFPHKLPYERAERIITQALARAEVLHQQFSASATPEQRRWPSFEAQQPRLARFCDFVIRPGASPHREGGGTTEEADLDAALTRALLYLWVYFDDECARRAQEVGAPLLGGPPHQDLVPSHTCTVHADDADDCSSAVFQRMCEALSLCSASWG